jgi:excisionase family DNA binding protein
MSEPARLHPDDIEAIARRLAEFANRRSSPWMSAEEAAIYLRCPLSRIRKLTMTCELPHERDGRRVLYHRDQLDQFIRAGGRPHLEPTVTFRVPFGKHA